MMFTIDPKEYRQKDSLTQHHFLTEDIVYQNNRDEV